MTVIFRRRRPGSSSLVAGLVLLILLLPWVAPRGWAQEAKAPFAHQWSDQELNALRSLWLGSLPPLPQDPSNRYADNPKAISLGKTLFFDTGLSANGQVSCGTCHRPEYSFSDDLPLARGMGTTSRRTMPLIGSAYQSSFFWDGRKDSLWSQAIGPIESAVEHGISRTFCAHRIKERYRAEYEQLFGPLPPITHKTCPPLATPLSDNPAARKAWAAMKAADREAVNTIYANIGKVIAAYVRRLVPLPSRFDRYVEAILNSDRARAAGILSPEEAEGLRLFIGKAECTNCHNGPLFTNSSFHRVGLKSPDRGRAEGIGKVLADEFNCLGRYSDAPPEQCLELRFIDRDTKKYEGAFKTPSLRNVADRPPYMHAGQLKTVREVLAFYQSESASKEIGHRGLSDGDLLKLELFLKTLGSPLRQP